MEKVLTRTVYNRVLIAEAWTSEDVLQEYVLTRWQPVMQRLESFISMKTAAGIFRPIEPGLAARMLLACFIAAILPVLRGIEPPPSAQQRRMLAVSVVGIISNGLSIQEG